ncbi:MAG TPA: DUF488 family protein [Gammaproteobacteria bacterium]|nr:DUF488 family protein [Gammaproteobacteria bacterium]
MSVRIVRLGSPRRRGEGLRLGTVRHPPRGVPKAEFARRNFYDLWLPTLAPSQDLLRTSGGGGDVSQVWPAFARGYRAEMKAPDAAHLLDLLAALSHTTNFSVGCYCEDETYCHRSLLRELLAKRGARIAAT